MSDTSIQVSYLDTTLATKMDQQNALLKEQNTLLDQLVKNMERIARAIESK